MPKKNRDQIKVLLFQLREDQEEKRVEFEAFARAARLRPEQIASFDVMRRIPDASALAGIHAIFIGGSKYSVFEQVPNLAALIGVLKAAREKTTPIFGSCFGAQLLAHAFGGEVIRDKANAERGTFEIQGSDETFTDILFADMPDKFPAQEAHQDRIAKPPSGAVVLASSPRCPVQAFAIPGADIYGTQFHPERSKADFERLIDLRKNDHANDPADLDAAKATLKESPEAESLVAKFIDRIVTQR